MLLAAQPPVRPAEIAVTVQGEAHASPDRAIVSLGVMTRAATATQAARENAAIQQAVIDTLRSMGFEQAAVTTSNYSVRPDFRNDPNAQLPTITGYLVSNAVRVLLRDPSQASRVIDATLAKGANSVNGLQFSIADPVPVREQAILDAVKRARSDAEALARAAGGSLGPVLEMTTAQGNSTSIFARGVAGGTLTPIEPGQSTVTVPVTIRWALVQP